MTPRRCFGHAAVLVVLAVACSDSLSLAQIVGTAHDFSASAWSRGEICRPCHAPHNAVGSLAAPLWDHALSNAVYTLYTSPTLKQAAVQPGEMSKFCLCCHDGTVAADAFGGETGTHYLTGTANLSTDLSNDHPVGMPWAHQTLGGGSDCSKCHNFHPPAGWRSPVEFFGPVGAKKVECASCHDPHGAGVPSLLRSTNSGSALCLACHQNK